MTKVVIDRIDLAMMRACGLDTQNPKDVAIYAKAKASPPRLRGPRPKPRLGAKAYAVLFQDHIHTDLYGRLMVFARRKHAAAWTKSDAALAKCRIIKIEIEEI